MRLIEDGRFGSHLMRLMVSQNAPFLPMYNAWHANSRELLPYDAEQARRDAAAIDAKVLSNRRPPYSIAGGLYDALKSTNGDILCVSNLQAQRASKLFFESEGIDIHPASAVALASLIERVRAEEIERDATIMLNITGGGEMRYKAENRIYHLQPNIIFPLNAENSDVIAKVERLFR